MILNDILRDKLSYHCFNALSLLLWFIYFVTFALSKNIIEGRS
ncbi:hypothetical protein HMPREF0766_11718 [Sphingobacterium spiritivorum ATCC 33861]|uniref:Uncharacterized protein n=1 Tax=Sphingobacterium spiritivorum ATCC 33861 TaxID=525373 RepID=D7VL49_SPHSI|nr:hypothetical protein HMPREF0766_11718 [Sphingobacterium spiritivorum ATCC 33861]